MYREVYKIIIHISQIASACACNCLWRLCWLCHWGGFCARDVDSMACLSEFAATSLLNIDRMARLQQPLDHSFKLAGNLQMRGCLRMITKVLAHPSNHLCLLLNKSSTNQPITRTLVDCGRGWLRFRVWVWESMGGWVMALWRSSLCQRWWRH